MFTKEYDIKKVYMGRLEHDSDLLKSMNKLVKEKNIRTGKIELVGASKVAIFSYYDDKERKYYPVTIKKHLEIVKAIGNISINNGEPMVHLHIIFSDEEGKCFGGHLEEGTIVFAGEFSITVLEGEDLVREYDEVTGLTLWKKS